MQFEIPLDKDFVDKFEQLEEKYGEEMVELNGFGNNHIGLTTFIDNFIDADTVADATIDGNANVGHKDIVALTSEMSKPQSKLLAFNKIYYEIKKKWNRGVANNWLEAEWNGKLYLHDAASSTYVPYCYAYDIENLVNKGLYFIENFNGEAPQHLTTFTDFVGEFVSWTSNRSSGACGLPSFLIYSFYFWKKDCEEGYAINSPEYYARQEFQRITYKLNQPYLRINQSAFTNFSIFDHSYLEELFGGKTYPKEITTVNGEKSDMIIDFIDEIIEYEKLFLEVVSEIRSKNMMTFPVLSISLLRKDGKFVDEDFARWACKHNMKWADSNFFVSDDITSLSNCCRLISDVKNMGYFNSVGGTALEVGSVKVNTINLARVAYSSKDEKDVFNQLEKVLFDCLVGLDAVRHIIRRNIEKGLLPNYTYELMHLENQYSTIGIVGYFEMLQHFNMTYEDEFGYTYYTDEGLHFLENVLAFINEYKDNWDKGEADCKYNVEAIPGERAAAVLMEKDKLLYPNEKYTLPLYGNQWIPLGIKCTLDEKIKLSAALDKACNGGSIAHINIESPFTNFETAWNMLNKVADAGVVYFAFCTRISACKNNHGFYGEICPECGNPKETTYQRIVGFLTPEKTYSKERKAEFKRRTWFDLNNMKEM